MDRVGRWLGNSVPYPCCLLGPPLGAPAAATHSHLAECEPESPMARCIMGGHRKGQDSKGL